MIIKNKFNVKIIKNKGNTSQRFSVEIMSFSVNTIVPIRTVLSNETNRDKSHF